MFYKFIVFSICLGLIISDVNGLLKRCFTCRSRGDLGTCKDPFTLNSTQADAARGVDAAPCASGWCGKMIEGGNTYKDDDYGIATQRMCLQRGPSDNEERCAHTVWNYKKVYMCFCVGDLCNDATTVNISYKGLLTCLPLLIYFYYFL